MKPGCPFCDYAGPSPIRHDFGDVIVFAPLNPVAPGHLLVVPKKHVRNALVSPEITARVFEMAARVASEHGQDVDAPCNLITSVGEAATQTVGHFHVHVVPRRPGDGLALPWAPATEPGQTDRRE